MIHDFYIYHEGNFFFTKSCQDTSKLILPDLLMIKRTLLDDLSLVPTEGLDSSIHTISGVFRTFHVCVCVKFSHLSKTLWNFLYTSASRDLNCGHYLISLQNARITLCGSPYKWCIIFFAVSYPSFGGNFMIFLTIFFTSPVMYLISHVNLGGSPFGFSIFFDSIVKGSLEIIGFCQTHLYLFLEQVIDSQVCTSSLQH